MVEPARELGDRLLEDHRVEQEQIGRDTVARLAPLWRIIEPTSVDSSATVWVDAVLPVIEDGFQESQQAADRFVRDYRQAIVPDAEPLVSVEFDDFPEERATVSVIVTGPVEVKRQLPAPDAGEKGFASSSAAAVKIVADGGRQAVEQLVELDEEAIGYARKCDSNPCYFCAMLASRGAVYKKDSFVLANRRFKGEGVAKTHDNCQCTLRPVYESDDSLDEDGRDAEAQEMWRIWEESTGILSNEAERRAFRRAWENRDAPEPEGPTDVPVSTLERVRQDLLIEGFEEDSFQVRFFDRQIERFGGPSAPERLVVAPSPRPNPPVQVEVPLEEATPQQVLDTAAGIAAHLRLQLDQRANPVERPTPLNPADYDLPEIADTVLQSGLNIQPLEYIHRPVIDRASTTAMLDTVFGLNRSYLPEAQYRGVTRPYSASGIESGDRADALRIAVALKHLDRDDIGFDLRPHRARFEGTAEAPTLIDEILADGVNVELLMDPRIDPDVDTQIRVRLEKVIAAAKVKDDAALAAAKLAESRAAQAKWDENRAETGAPFKAYLTTYRGADVDALSQNKLYEINHAVHSWLGFQSDSSWDSAPAGRLTGGARISDFDMQAVNNDIIDSRLNVAEFTNPDVDDLEYEEIGRGLWAILQNHRRVDDRPLPSEVLGAPRAPKAVKGAEFVDVYSDFAAAVDELGFDIGDSETLRNVFDDVLKSGLNMRLIGDPNAPADLKAAASEAFWRLIDGDLPGNVAPSPSGVGRAGGIAVAREVAMFGGADSVIPEIDDRIGFMDRLQFENDFLAVPLAARQVLGERNVRVVASRRVSEGPFSDLFDGITAADGRGIDEISFYQNQIGAVVISTDAPNGSVNVVAHEIGHALDSRALQGNPVDVVWQEQGNPNLPPNILSKVQEPVTRKVEKFVNDPYIKWAHKQFVVNNTSADAYYRTGSEGTDLSGREEWIAEGYAACVTGNDSQLLAISGGSGEAADILRWTFRRMGVLP